MTGLKMTSLARLITEFTYPRPIVRRRVQILLVTLAAIVLRVYYKVDYPGGWDDVDFALGVDWYDLSMMQPHFPGYPIYIFLGKLLRPFFTNAFSALSMISAIAGGLTVIPIWKIGYRLVGQGLAWTASLIWMVAPLAVVSGIQPTSEAVGVLFFCMAVADGLRAVDPVMDAQIRDRAWLWQGIWLALMLGVRVSYLPLVSIWIWVWWRSWKHLREPIISRQMVRSVGGFMCICAAWSAALIVSAGGLSPLLQMGFSFTEGHFSDWGGAYQGNQSLAARTWLLIVRQMFAAGLGTVWEENVGWRWIPTLIVGIAIIGWLRWKRGQSAFNHSASFWIAWLVPYGLWVLLAQNIDKPRHILPLLPALIFMIALGLKSGFAEYRRTLGVLLIVWWISTLVITFPIAMEARNETSPMVQLAHYVSDQYPASNTVVFAYEESRVMQVVAPQYTAITLRSWEYFRNELLQTPHIPEHVLATGEVIAGMSPERQQAFRKVDAFQQAAVFKGSEWLYPTYHTIVLYEAKAGLSQLVNERRGN